MDEALAFHQRYSQLRGLFWLFFIGILHMSCATAGGVLSGTKMIFNGQESSASALVSNISDQVLTVRVWVSERQEDSSVITPFIAMPAIFTVPPGAEQVLRVMKTPGELAQDRESAFYLNAQKVPLEHPSQDDVLNIADTEQIELFYRPENLSEKAVDAVAQVHWQLIAEAGVRQLRVTNSSAYYVTLVGVKVNNGHKTFELGALEMLAPRSAQDYSLGNMRVAKQLDVEFSVVKDDGRYTKPFRSKAYF